MPSMPMRRKKWTEEEEETLISKYGELLQSGFLSKMKTRERKFEPIAAHVNALFNSQNPLSYPWQWTWKDVSTKVQNMRHQYLGVKQKVRPIVPPVGGDQHEECHWEDGLNHWSNFLKYKEVFGDQDLDVNDFFVQGYPSSQTGRNGPRILLKPSSNSLPKDFSVGVVTDGTGLVIEEKQSSLNRSTADKECILDAAARIGYAHLDEEIGVTGTELGFDFECDGRDIGRDDYDEDDGDATDLNRRMKREQRRNSEVLGLEYSMSEPRMFSFFAHQFSELREREARREEREMEREKRQLQMAEAEKERARQREEEQKREHLKLEELRQSEAERREEKRKKLELKRDLLEQERREELERERAWNEKMERVKSEWKEKMEAQTLQHQAAMMQIQAQIFQCQQNTVALLTGVLRQLGCQSTDLTGQGSSVGTFVSQLLQNLQTPGDGDLSLDKVSWHRLTSANDKDSRISPDICLFTK